MAADGAGIQASTVRRIALAWILTLPAAMTLAGLFYWSLLAAVGLLGGQQSAVPVRRARRRA